VTTIAPVEVAAPMDAALAPAEREADFWIRWFVIIEVV
jgi:hypothetical protein